MQKLIRDIHAACLEISEAAKPGAISIMDIAKPRLEYAMTEKDICRTHALVEPFLNRLVRKADILRHLALNGDLYTRLKNHDIRLRRTAYSFTVGKCIRRKLKELERTDGVEVGEILVKKPPDPAKVRRLPEFRERNRTRAPRIYARPAELAQHLSVSSTGKSEEVPALVIYHFFSFIFILPHMATSVPKEKRAENVSSSARSPVKFLPTVQFLTSRRERNAPKKLCFEGKIRLSRTRRVRKHPRGRRALTRLSTFDPKFDFFI